MPEKSRLRIITGTKPGDLQLVKVLIFSMMCLLMRIRKMFKKIQKTY